MTYVCNVMYIAKQAPWATNEKGPCKNPCPQREGSEWVVFLEEEP